MCPLIPDSSFEPGNGGWRWIDEALTVRFVTYLPLEGIERNPTCSSSDALSHYSEPLQ